MDVGLYKGGCHMELTTKRRVSGREKGVFKLHLAAGMIAASFLISRACFMGQMFPAAIALITVLLSFHTLHLYLLPFMLLGLVSLYPTGAFIWGHAAALCGCAAVFLCTGKIRLAIWHKAVIAGAITITARSISCIAAGLTYQITAGGLVLEGCLVAALCGVFQAILQMRNGEGPLGGDTGGLAALCSAVLCLVCGTGFPALLLPAAMAVTLFVAYLLGIIEGLLAAFVSSIFLLLCGGSIGTLFLLSAGGAAAGAFRKQGKAVSALCFAATVMAVSRLDGSISLELPFYGPIVGALLLILIPQRWIRSMDIVIARMLKNGSFDEKQQIQEASVRLEKLQKTFDELSALFVSQDNRRILMSYQFKAMAEVLEYATKGLSARPMPAPAYGIRPAQAGYAKNKGISGDSYMWAPLPGNRFAAILSDGMGSGRIAAGESSLAVTTVIRLLEMGVETEPVLRLLNEILLLNADKEVFSTIDLGIFNQKSGKINLYKIGAAPTFIKRKHSVEVLSVSAMPLGIVDGLKMECVTACLSPGDEVIMISDGVTDCRREDLSMEWLKETIQEIHSKDPQTMCDLIINRAVEQYGDREKDDLTVMTLRVESL